MMLPLCIGIIVGCASAQRGPADPSGWTTVIENFRIGWYDSAYDPGGPARLASLGFDFAMPYVGSGDEAVIGAYLNAAADSRLPVYLEIPRALAKRQGAELDDYVRRHAATPGLLGWYLYDEPEWKLSARPAMLKRAYSRIKELAPELPISLTFMFSNLASPYREAMDEMWFDFYPIERGSKEFAAFRNGRYADKIKQTSAIAESLGKPLNLVVQGFGEDKNGTAQFGRRLPTMAEAEYQFHASLLGRPSSLAYWTLYRSDPRWVAETLAPIIREFRERFPRGIIYKSVKGFVVAGGACDTIVLGNGEGRWWLLVVGCDAVESRMAISSGEGFGFASGNPARNEVILAPYGTVFLELTGTEKPAS